MLAAQGGGEAPSTYQLGLLWAGRQVKQVWKVHLSAPTAGPASNVPRLPLAQALDHPYPRRGLHPPVQSTPEMADRLACTVSAAPRDVPTRTQMEMLSPMGICAQDKKVLSVEPPSTPGWGGCWARKRRGLALKQAAPSLGLQGENGRWAESQGGCMRREAIHAENRG